MAKRPTNEPNQPVAGEPSAPAAPAQQPATEAAPAHAQAPTQAQVEQLAALKEKRAALLATEAEYQRASAAYRELCDAADAANRQFQAKLADAQAAIDKARAAWVEAAPKLKAIDRDIVAISG